MNSEKKRMDKSGGPGPPNRNPSYSKSNEYDDFKNRYDENKESLIMKKKTGITKFGKWQCAYCAEEYTMKYRLEVHMGQRHSEKEPVSATGVLLRPKIFFKWQCAYCAKEYTRKYALEVHMGKRHSDKEPVSATGALLRPKNEGNKEIHDKSSYTFGVIKSTTACPECGKLYCSKNSAAKHIAIQHNDLLPYHKGGFNIPLDFLAVKCPICAKTCLKEKVRLHIFRFHKSHLPYQYCEWSITLEGFKRLYNACPVCPYQLPLAGSLGRHIAEHHGSLLPFKIDSDFTVIRSNAKKFKNVSIDTTLINRASEVLFQCKGCSYSNVSYVAYLVHLQINHNDELLLEITNVKKEKSK